MSCFPFGVFSAPAVEDWIRFPIPCPPPRPQQPPQQPPPKPPPPQAYVETSYHLSFPPFVGAKVKVFWADLNDYIFPSSRPSSLQWQYYPTRYARPRIFTTTTNPMLHTYLRPIVDDLGEVYVAINSEIPNPPDLLIVMQLLYHDQDGLLLFMKFISLLFLHHGMALLHTTTVLRCKTEQKSL
jgi:hypothetical protein